MVLEGKVRNPPPGACGAPARTCELPAPSSRPCRGPTVHLLHCRSLACQAPEQRMLLIAELPLKHLRAEDSNNTSNQTDRLLRAPRCVQGSVLRIQYAVWTQPGMEPGGFEKDNQVSAQCPCLLPRRLVPFHIKTSPLDAGRPLFSSCDLRALSIWPCNEGFRGLLGRLQSTRSCSWV